MMKRLLKLAREHGMHKITLYVVADNQIAIRLYQKFGFEIEGRIRDSFFGEDGKYHDMLVMGKILSSENM
mgnify:CR=1 FL=1